MLNIRHLQIFKLININVTLDTCQVLRNHSQVAHGHQNEDCRYRTFRSVLKSEELSVDPACLVAGTSQTHCGLVLATLKTGIMFSSFCLFSSFKLRLNSQLRGSLLWAPTVLSSTISTYCTVFKLSISGD